MHVLQDQQRPGITTPGVQQAEQPLAKHHRRLRRLGQARPVPLRYQPAQRGPVRNKLS
jgi:hypothetical protein